MDETQKLFSDVKFVLAQCDQADYIKNLLIDGGAKHINYLSDNVTHVISDRQCVEADEALELYERPVVCSSWVHLSLKANRLLPHEAFSPYKRIFQDVIATFSKDLSQSDVDILAATITYYGGKITKSVEASTHYIVTTPAVNDQLGGTNSNLKIVAPDWVIDSVKEKSCCNELHYEPNLLLGPPPPTPPPALDPIPIVEAQDSKEHESTKAKQTEGDESSRSQTAVTKASQSTSSDPPQEPVQQQQSQPPQSYGAPQQPPQSQIPRMASMTVGVRGPQPRFKPILPMQNANMPPMQQRQPQIRQPARVMVPDHQQQPRKANLNYSQSNQKVSPFLNNVDSQQQPQMQAQQFTSLNLPMNQQQPVNSISQQPQSRLPLPTNVYHQPRGPYANNHAGPREGVVLQQHPSQRPMVNQSGQMVNKFQDSSNQIQPQRQYQICVQQPQQSANANYQHQQSQPTMHRPQIYYNQNPNQPQQIRISPQGAMMRQPIPSEPIHDGYNNNQHQSPELTQTNPSAQQHYHTNHPNQTPYQPQNPQPQQRLLQPQHPSMPSQYQNHQAPQMQHQPMVQPPKNITQQPRPPFNQPIPVSAPTGIRPPRGAIANHNEPRLSGPRQPSNIPQLRGPRAPSGTQHSNQQLHPSIFDNKRESSLAIIKAKVPNLTDTIEYFGFDNKIDVPKNKPFLGCKFKFIEYDDINPKLKMRWIDVIKESGGTFGDEIDDTITLLICETRSRPEFTEALRKGIRCATVYWINDVLEEDKFSFPWKALHIPLAFPTTDRPLEKEVISITNFKGKERREVQELISKTGAKFTDYFSQHNTLLVCKVPGNDKYERAIEWKIPIVNCKLLTDYLLSPVKDLTNMLAQSKYQIFNRSENPLKITSYAPIRDIMDPWRKPLQISIERQQESHHSLTNGTANEDSKNVPKEGSISHEVSQDLNSTAIVEEREQNRAREENISQPNESDVPAELDASTSSNYESAPSTQQMPDKLLRKSNEPIRLLLTHLEHELASKLQACAQKLGISFASSPVDCTHLVVDRISRTPKFICAFSHANYILSHNWLLDSSEVGTLLDEKQYILKDSDGEEKFSFNLVYSLLKRKKRSGLLFNNLIFFVTPSIVAKVRNIKEMIESAGGSVVTKKPPTKSQIDLLKADGKRLVVVSILEDYYLCSSLAGLGIDIVSTEFVISGILRQDIDYDAHRINTNGELNKPDTSSEPINSPKRVRLYS